MSASSFCFVLGFFLERKLSLGTQHWLKIIVIQFCFENGPLFDDKDVASVYKNLKKSLKSKTNEQLEADKHRSNLKLVTAR